MTKHNITYYEHKSTSQCDECHYTERDTFCFAECRYTECRVANKTPTSQQGAMGLTVTLRITLYWVSHLLFLCWLSKQHLQKRWVKVVTNLLRIFGFLTLPRQCKKKEYYKRKPLGWFRMGLYQAPDGIANLKYKLLNFLTPIKKKFQRERL